MKKSLIKIIGCLALSQSLTFLVLGSNEEPQSQFQTPPSTPQKTSIVDEVCPSSPKREGNWTLQIWNNNQDQPYETSQSQSCSLEYFLQKIGEESLQKENITKIKIVNGTTIPYQFFKGLTSLKQVIIPKTITQIGARAFEGCASLTTFGCDEEDNGKIIIPENVTSVSSEAFAGCSNLTCVEFRNPDINVDTRLFQGCKKLNEIALPNSLKAIPQGFFGHCTHLSEIILPETITEIGNYAFHNCISLTEIEIPASTESIGDCAFWNDTKHGESKLRKVVLSATEEQNGVQTIGKEAFANSTALEEINLQNVKQIGQTAFRNCPKLKRIALNSNLTEISQQAFEKLGASTVNIPELVCKIGAQAFAKSKIKQVNFEGTEVKEIGKKAFAETEQLNNITIPPSVNSIGPNAFEKSNLQSFAIDAANQSEITILNSQGGNFKDCKNLTELTLPFTVKIQRNPQTAPDPDFANPNAVTKIIITGDSAEMDDEATQLQSFAFFEYFQNNNIGKDPNKLVTVEVENSDLWEEALQAYQQKHGSLNIKIVQNEEAEQRRIASLENINGREKELTHNAQNEKEDESEIQNDKEKQKIQDKFDNLNDQELIEPAMLPQSHAVRNFIIGSMITGISGFLTWLGYRYHQKIQAKKLAEAAAKAVAEESSSWFWPLAFMGASGYSVYYLWNN